MSSSDVSTDAKTTPARTIVDQPTTSRNYAKGDTFVTGASAELYEPIAEYEGRHRYDPFAEWTDKEERRVVRKVSRLFILYNS